MELISREAVKQAVRDKFKDLPTRCEINEVINSIPTAEPTKGRWIADKWENIWKMEVNCYRCSNCGIRAIDHSLIMSIVGLNYCPHCGAKMEVK